MRYRNNGQIEEELQIRFTGYLIQAVKRTRRDYLNTLNQWTPTLRLGPHCGKTYPTTIFYCCEKEL